MVQVEWRDGIVFCGWVMLAVVRGVSDKVDGFDVMVGMGGEGQEGSKDLLEGLHGGDQCFRGVV